MDVADNMELYLSVAEQLVVEGKDNDAVQKHLASIGADESTIEIIITQIKSSNYLKRRKRGVLLGGIGSLLLITGFVLTVIFYHSGIPFHYVMYGMTSIGVLLLLAGLVEVIGW